MEVGPTIEQLLKDYDGKIKVVYKYFVVHEPAVVPGLAACAANRQGKFVEMEALIWDKGFAQGELGSERMEVLAGEAGLDVSKFKTDMAGDDCMEWLKRDYQQLTALGVNGTPAFYINGRFISGNQPIGVFRKLIDEELAKADAAIGKGVAVEDYYAKEVLAKGKSKL